MPPTLADLRTIPLFRGFSDNDLVELSALFEPVPGSGPLFSAGDTAQHLFLLSSGEVTLDRVNDDVFRMRPPALIGELGALTGLPRTSTANPSADAVVHRVAAARLQAWLGENQEVGVRFLVNLLEIVADKVQRDQVRIADMRGNLVRTQKQLKQMRATIEEAEETSISAPLHASLEALISTNRRVNYRVNPPSALKAHLRIDNQAHAVSDLSRTHLGINDLSVGKDAWISGVLDLAGVEIPVSGQVIRSERNRVVMQLDLLIDEYAAHLEGYLTRVQLLDIMA